MPRKTEDASYTRLLAMLVVSVIAFPILAEIVIYRVVAVGAVTTVRTTLYTPSPVADQTGELAPQEAEDGG